MIFRSGRRALAATFEYGKVRRWLLRTPIPKRGMATKKGAIQKTPPVPCEARDTAFRAGFLCSFLSPAVTKERRAAVSPEKILLRSIPMGNLKYQRGRVAPLVGYCLSQFDI